jgi:hypothetical protein
VEFINTTNIEDKEILDKIHLNFRFIFLRDTAAARWIEEATHDTLIIVYYPLYL